jgi:hypothetical protein
MSHALNRALEEPAAVDGAPALEGKASSVLSGKADCAVTKLPPIRGLHIPQPPHRLGQETSFCNTHLSAPGEVANPDVATPASGLRDHAFKLIRVLDDQGAAVGPWNPHLQLAELKQALRHMMLTRVFDERMHRAQRQGKTSFYMQCRGEEAIACAQTMALRPDDMCFPTYRMQGILIARGYPLLDMMNQIYSNAQDPLKAELTAFSHFRAMSVRNTAKRSGGRWPAPIAASTTLRLPGSATVLRRKETSTMLLRSHQFIGRP